MCWGDELQNEIVLVHVYWASHGCIMPCFFIASLSIPSRDALFYDVMYRH
jgi:hypothetical protein